MATDDFQSGYYDVPDDNPLLPESGDVRAYYRFVLSRLLSAIVLISLLLVAISFPPQGALEFKRSQNALKSVSSWRENVIIVNGKDSVEEDESEIVCPDTGHWLRHKIWRAADGTLNDWTDERLRVANTVYVRSAYSLSGHDPAQFTPWRATDAFVAPLACSSAPAAMAASHFPDYKQLLDNGAIEFANFDSVNGIACRDWIVQSRATASSEVHICIEPRTLLPLRVRTAGLERTFSDWNAASKLDIVELVDRLNAGRSGSHPTSGAQLRDAAFSPPTNP